MKKNTIFALGFFDGVHLGHQALLAACRQEAARMGCDCAAITFASHPQSLFVATPPALINTGADRAALLSAYGAEHIIEYPVTKEVMSTPWQKFLTDLLAQGAAGFVCGDDFRFGHKGEGDAKKLAEFCRERNLPCVIVPEQSMDGVRIASTHIRKLLEAGQLDKAVKFLGHPHILSGRVVSGRQIGRTIGVPTANILIPEGVVVPQLGVYACRVTVESQSFAAVTNIGSRPTVGGHQVRAESWILDFSGDLYGKELRLEFHHFLRPEQKFTDLEALRLQIQQDADHTRQLLR